VSVTESPNLTDGPSPPGFVTSEDAAKLLGIPYRSLMHWVEYQLVEPYRAGNRQRAPRLWSEKHIREARVIKTLRDDGVSMQAVKRAMDYLRREGYNPFSTGKFLALNRGAEVIHLRDEEDAISLLKEPGQRLLLFVDLDQATSGKG